MKMPAGKFKGKEVDQLPSGYLRWVAENWKEDSPRNRQICRLADEEYQHREHCGMHFNDDKTTEGINCPHCGKVIRK